MKFPKCNDGLLTAVQMAVCIGACALPKAIGNWLLLPVGSMMIASAWASFRDRGVEAEIIQVASRQRAGYQQAEITVSCKNTNQFQLPVDADRSAWKVGSLVRVYGTAKGNPGLSRRVGAATLSGILGAGLIGLLVLEITGNR